MDEDMEPKIFIEIYKFFILVVYLVVTLYGCKNKVCTKKRPTYITVLGQKVKHGEDWNCWSNGAWKWKKIWKYGKLHGVLELWKRNGTLKEKWSYQKGHKIIMWDRVGKTQMGRAEPIENIKKIVNLCKNWYLNEQIDKKNKITYPVHFPRGMYHIKRKKVFYTPEVRPCVHGSPQYPANLKRWHKEPWKTISFQIPTAHHFQYIYSVQGISRNSIFTLIARADLDCDGIFSTYKIKAHIDSQTGWPVISKLTIKRPFE